MSYWEELAHHCDEQMWMAHPLVRRAINERVTGEIGVKLYKGSARVVTRASPNAVYDASLASFAASGGLFSQSAAPGFIELWSLQSRLAWRLRNRPR